MPILDLKVWIGKNKEGEVKILHEHYMKDVTNRGVVHAKSSHGKIMKRNVLVNDCLRIMRNCSEEIDTENGIEKHLTYFMNRLQFSGYDMTERRNILEEAFYKFDLQAENITNVSNITQNKTKKRRKKKDSWYMKESKYETIMIVDASPGEILKRTIQREAKKHNIKIKVVERRGMTVKTKLQKSDPFERKKCKKDDCVTCKKEIDIDCRRRGVVYEIECKEDNCGKKYIGQTGRTVYERMKEHVRKVGTDRVDVIVGAVEQHSKECHRGRDFKFQVRIKDNNFGRPTRRMITEAVRIDSLDKKKCFNRKLGWANTMLYRERFSREDTMGGGEVDDYFEGDYSQ